MQADRQLNQCRIDRTNGWRRDAFRDLDHPVEIEVTLIKVDTLELLSMIDMLAK